MRERERDLVKKRCRTENTMRRTRHMHASCTDVNSLPSDDGQMSDGIKREKRESKCEWCSTDPVKAITSAMVKQYTYGRFVSTVPGKSIPVDSKVMCCKTISVTSIFVASAHSLDLQGEVTIFSAHTHTNASRYIH